MNRQRESPRPFSSVESGMEQFFARFGVIGQKIYWLLLLTFVIVIILLPVIKVTVSTQAAGMLRSSLSNNVVTSSEGGRIIELKVEENQFVEAGDTLLLLENSHLYEKLAVTEDRIVDYQKYLKDLRGLLDSSHTGGMLRPCTELFRAELLQFQQRLVDLNLTIKHRERSYNRMRSLMESGAVAVLQVEKEQFALEQAQQAKAIYIDQKRNSWQEKLRDYTFQVSTLRSDRRLLEKELEKFCITAPVSGQFIELAPIIPGNFLPRSSEIGRISYGDDLIVEAFINPRDIGWIHTGMQAKFRVDAFDHHQWGMVSGKVRSISGDALSTSSGPVFKVICSLDQDYLSLSNGYRCNLKRGMTVVAGFEITRRSILQLLYDNHNDWLNPYVPPPLAER